MSDKLFDFGVDIPTKITKYTKRFTDLEGFLDEDYDGEHHMLWDNQDECWICLDDVLCLMEKEYVNIKEENEQLKKENNDYEKQFRIINEKLDEYIKTADTYRIPISSLKYGDDLGYFNGVYQYMKKLKKDIGGIGYE